MACRIHVYVHNFHFSQEYADIHNQGQESEMNKLYDWQDELVINEAVDAVKECAGEFYILEGVLPSGEQFKKEVGGMHLASITCSSGLVNQVGCSMSILDKMVIEKIEEDFVVSIWIKGNEPLANPVPGIYIASKEFPNELIF